ncbi:MAG: hypothetical protein R3C15_21670 [Thermoleophilia bacterium]
MRQRVGRARVSPAMGVALVALFVALGGGAYAAFELPRNSVTSRAIAPGAVRTADLARGAVTAPKLRRGAVTTEKLARGAVTAPKLAAGAVRTPALARGAVTAATLAPGAVTGAAVADGSIGDAHLASGISGAKVAGQVASAQRADVAGRVDSVNGVTVQRVDFRGSEGQPPTTILDLGGLQVQALCQASPAPFRVVATTSVADAMIHTGGITTTGVGHGRSDTSFQPGETFDLFDAPLALVGTTVFATPAGGIVEVSFRSDAFGSRYACGFQGVATASPAP